MTGRRLTRIGTVLESDGVHVVGFAHQCTGCGARALCGRGPAGATRKSVLTTESLDLADLVPGTRVEVSVREQGLNGAAIWLFGAPLLLLLGGAQIGALLAGAAGWPPQVMAPLAGCTGFLLAVAAVRARARDLLAALDLRGVRGSWMD